jgi:hypothetical protein
MARKELDSKFRNAAHENKLLATGDVGWLM